VLVPGFVGSRLPGDRHLDVRYVGVASPIWGMVSLWSVIEKVTHVVHSCELVWRSGRVCRRLLRGAEVGEVQLPNPMERSPSILWLAQT